MDKVVDRFFSKSLSPKSEDGRGVKGSDDDERDKSDRENDRPSKDFVRQKLINREAKYLKENNMKLAEYEGSE